MSHRATLGLLLGLAAAGCAGSGQYDRVVLLPEPDGSPGHVSVATERGSKVELEGAFQAARIEGSRVRTEPTSEAEVRRAYGDLLGALPPRPVNHTLYFVTDSDELASESAADARTILAELAKRPLADIVVIGHTDSVGKHERNDALSLQRARAVRERLIALGGDPARITIAGRGEREPAVDVGDEVAEPRNRRVELTVR